MSFTVSTSNLSQPGGWTIDDHGRCKATLRPINEFGSPGEITVVVTSDQCQDSVTITAGCFNFAVQASVDDGATWHDEVFIEGNPGLTVDVPVRVVMTATSGETDAWSYSVKHDPSLLEANGGDIEVVWATMSGTQAESLSPWWHETEARVDAAQNSIGYTQGVVIDDEMSAWVDPTVGFVTSAACYRITMPSEGSYQVDVFLTDDIGDGRPPIDTLIAQDGEGIRPCFRNLTIHIESSASVTHPTLTCTGVTYVDPAEDGTPGPGGEPFVFVERQHAPGHENPCDGIATSEVILPVSCGDANNDSTVTLEDAKFIMALLFPHNVDPEKRKTAITVSTEYLITRQSTCWDGFYRRGVMRSYTADDNGTPADTSDDTDALDGAESHSVPTDPPLDSWRLPNAFEIMTLVDFEKTSTPVLPSVFNVAAGCPLGCDPDDSSGNCFGCDRPFWTSTTATQEDLVQDFGYHLIINEALESTDGSIASGTLGDATLTNKTAPLMFGHKRTLDCWVLPVHDDPATDCP